MADPDCKGKKKAAAAPAPTPGLKPKRPKPAASKKFSRAPKRPAVLMSLKPEAVREGATYVDAIRRARAAINLAELGVGSGKLRRSMTGAVLMELPKETSTSQADTLAKKLAEVIGEVAEVTRPTKMAEIRVGGLDESRDAGGRLCGHRNGGDTDGHC